MSGRLLGLLAAIALGGCGGCEGAEGARCGEGFSPRGARCCVAGLGPCTAAAPGDATIAIPAADFSLIAGDWEAQGAAPIVVKTAPFRIDRHELLADDRGDPARVAGGLSAAAAEARCAARGGRLPTREEWLAAAAWRGPQSGAATVTGATRYPWGGTGAVCRRAAFGLVRGPCAEIPDAGPDTACAHPSGDTGAGLCDVAGNVAEWVRVGGGHELRGGSFATSFAAELRLWAATTPPPGAAPADAGARCVYAP